MNGKQKRKLFEIISGAILLAAAYIVYKTVDLRFPFDLLIFLPAYAVAGYDVLIEAVQNIAAGEIFGENLLMSVASIGAMAIGEFPEAVFVMLFYKVGSLFESIAVGKSRSAIRSLTAMKPSCASVERDGVESEVPIEEVSVGDTVVVRPGERIPVDGVIVHGDGNVDASALTGEAVPVYVKEGDRVLSGTMSKNSVLKIKVDTVFEESTVSKIVELVENSSCTKAKSEKFITTFSKYYTPAVITAAVLLAVIPSIVTGNAALWIKRALVFLVVSCPCALVISIPLSYFAGIGNAAKRGILIKGSDYLESLAKAGSFVFDKTGTITEGSFKVSKIAAHGCGEDELLFLAACAESGSVHPLAKAVCAEYASRGSASPLTAEDYEELPGLGVTCSVNGERVAAGNEKLMRSYGVEPEDVDGTCIHVMKNGVYAGVILLSDEPKRNAKRAISELRARGRKTYMLSGDRLKSAEDVCREVGIDEVSAELLPEEKTKKLKEISEATEGLTVFTGDGINDAPSIASADVGIAMGALGSDIAIECADVVLLDDDPIKVSEAYDLSLRVRRTVIQNIVFALAVKAVVLILGALGKAPMWAAVIADVGVSVVAILNSMRLMRK